MALAGVISAPGKIILSGEHAVVYGYPAVLSAVDKRLVGSFAVSRDTIFPSDNFLENIEEWLKQKVNISIQSDIPTGCGMGSSAAFSVVNAAAALALQGKKKNLPAINRLAYEMEKKHHGNASGADPAVCAYGGFLWYRKETERLKIIQPIKKRLQKQLCLSLIHSGKPQESTKDMVEYVAERRKGNAHLVDSLFKEIESISRMWSKVITGDESNSIIYQLVKENHRALLELGVVSPLAANIIREVEHLGGVAKITGAGGRAGGAGMIMVIQDDIEKLQKAAQQNGWEIIPVQLGEKGVDFS